VLKVVKEINYSKKEIEKKKAVIKARFNKES